MNSNRLIQLVFACIGLMIISGPAIAVDTEVAEVVSIEMKREANRILQDEILPTLQVAAYKDDNEITGQSSDGIVTINTKNYIGLDSFLEKNSDSETNLVFSGTGLPSETVVTIIFSSNLVRQSTMADESGAWSISVPVSQLNAGMHTATVQTIYQGIRSDAQVVAEFEVAATEALSMSTWIFLISSIVAILCLLFAITLQLHHNMHGFSADPLT